MAFEWKTFLEVAEYFCESEAQTRFGTEPALRCAAGRVYYAAFGHAMQYAERSLHLQRTGSAQDHALLRKHFRLHQMGEIAPDLDNLRTYRNQCDYDSTITDIDRQSQLAMRQARNVIDHLEETNDWILPTRVHSAALTPLKVLPGPSSPPDVNREP
ncbi:MAG: hypothetical protein IT210_01755 [Armatimonadetes bacterium]|nr:hypothetical protein [Armatimonadota bacterium]